MLNKDTTGLMIVDIQGKLSDLMHDSAAMFTQVQKLIKGAEVLGLPVIWMEQLPSKLGKTRPEIAALLPGQAYEKHSFSGMQNTEIAKAVQHTRRKQWLVAGLESHVCVYQTVCDLLRSQYEVHLVTDCVSSRVLANKELAIRKMEKLGAHLTSMELALFELQRVAEGPEFKQLIQIIK
ncbi:hydrolase [Venatoribacter cucullus]|uniref:hydrolase n=1 Tax=Venatoribacter cucullus TaxID=2661630 RepID=UPI00224071B3|nr:hydrolase [Venatoribacter cucullus]UZK03490.1 isochorismatase family protein [Venatoribacter cucullus]